MGLKNSCKTVGTDCSFEDTFFPYFFTHVQDYIKAGFIGFLAGKGMDNDTDFSNATEGANVGDGGWFFNQLINFDTKRPYLNVITSLEEQTKTNEVNISIENNTIIITNNTNQLTDISIFDIQGKLLNSIILESNTNYKTPNLNAGLYILNHNGIKSKVMIW